VVMRGGLARCCLRSSSANASTNLLVNREAPPFDNPDLRRALALALDRKSFIDILAEGQGDIGGAMLPPAGLWGMPVDFLATIPGYGPDVAKNRAMEEHAWRRGTHHGQPRGRRQRDRYYDRAQPAGHRYQEAKAHGFLRDKPRLLSHLTAFSDREVMFFWFKCGDHPGHVKYKGRQMNMCPKTSRVFRYLVSAFGLGAVIGWSSPSDAYIQQIVIDQTATVNFTPIILGTSTPGTATSYTIYTGRIFGELKPNDPDNNKIITDIDLAPKNNGRVEYIANFEIITPSAPTQRSGLMIHAVPNRGGNAINTSALIQGATYVQSGWQGDLLAQCSPSPAIPYPCFDLNSGPYGSLNTTTGVFTPPQVSDVAGVSGLKSLASFVVQVPVATNPNGKERDRGKEDIRTDPITGQVYSHVCTGTNGCGLAVGSAPTSTAQLVIQGPAFAPYQPASMDTNEAEFWTVSSQTFEGVDSKKTPIPSDQWAWAYCPSGWPGTPNPNWICLKNATFNPSLLYEMAYTAKNPLVLGVGFAAFRDLGSFLR
jgi:hypothetical protein